MQTIIKSDQKAFLKGQQMTESIRLTQDIIDDYDITEDNGAIIFLDQKKSIWPSRMGISWIVFKTLWIWGSQAMSLATHSFDIS